MVSTPSKPDVFLFVQSIIALVLTITLCAMLLQGAAIPDLLIGISGIVIGFYFGARQAASGIIQQAAAIQAVMQAVDGR